MWSFLTAIMMMGGVSQAEVVDGVWRRDDGAKFIIPLTYEEGFPMIYIPYEGEPLLRWSNWVDGLEGTQIEYVSPSKIRWTLTQAKEDPDRIRMESVNGIFTLRQIEAMDRTASGLGIWSSDSGNKFFLFEVQDQLWLVIWRPSGEKKLYQAQWSKGLEGTQFTYQSNKSYTVTINASNPERAIAVGGGRRYVWSKIHKPELPVEAIPTIHGLWETPNGKLIVELAPDRDGGEIRKVRFVLPQIELIADANWVAGMKGKQFVMSLNGKDVTCNFDPENPNVIESIDQGNVVRWSRSIELIDPVGNPDPSGVWKSTNALFELEVTSGIITKAQYLYPQFTIPMNAYWEPGKEGEIFYLEHDGKKIIGYYAPNLPNKLRTLAGGVEIIWDRK